MRRSLHSLRANPPPHRPFSLNGDDRAWIVLNLFADEPWRVIAHPFAHMLLNYNYPPTQGWFDEGFAEYFSSIRVTDKQVEIGADPELAPAGRKTCSKTGLKLALLQTR